MKSHWLQLPSGLMWPGRVAATEKIMFRPCYRQAISRLDQLYGFMPPSAEAASSHAAVLATVLQGSGVEHESTSGKAVAPSDKPDPSQQLPHSPQQRPHSPQQLPHSSQQSPQPPEYWAAVISGDPGVGKSSFGYIYCWHLAKMNKSFVLECDEGLRRVRYLFNYTNSVPSVQQGGPDAFNGEHGMTYQP